jgi:hypothetical protein
MELHTVMLAIYTKEFVENLIQSHMIMYSYKYSLFIVFLITLTSVADCTTLMVWL